MTDSQAQEKEAVDPRVFHAVGAVATGVAHDLRNILTVLRMQLLAPEDATYRVGMDRQLDRIYVLTCSLLALSEESRMPICRVDVSKTVDRVFRLLHGQAEVDNTALRKRVRQNTPCAYANPRRIEHLLVILLLNALNAVAARGGIVTVALRRDRERVRIDIRDTGPGIAPEHLPHLFEPFFTTRANRIGLGLFSARRIVEAHRGEITVSGGWGHGACVSVWLPIAEQIDPGVENPCLERTTVLRTEHVRP